TCKGFPPSQAAARQPPPFAACPATCPGLGWLQKLPCRPDGASAPRRAANSRGSFGAGGAEKGTPEFQAGLVLLAGLLLGNGELPPLSRSAGVRLSSLPEQHADWISSAAVRP